MVYHEWTDSIANVNACIHGYIHWTSHTYYWRHVIQCCFDIFHHRYLLITDPTTRVVGLYLSVISCRCVDENRMDGGRSRVDRSVYLAIIQQYNKKTSQMSFILTLAIYTCSLTLAINFLCFLVDIEVSSQVGTNDSQTEGKPKRPWCGWTCLIYAPLIMCILSDDIFQISSICKLIHRKYYYQLIRGICVT